MRKLIHCFLVLILALAISGCSQEEAKTTAKAPVMAGQTAKTENIMQSVTVYRASADGKELLLPEVVTVVDNGKSVMENALVTLVSTKPGDAKYDDVVPIGTKVLGLKIENGIAYADFSKEITKRGQGSYQEMMLTYAIVNTLTEFPEVKKVQILVEGKKILSFNGHMDLEDPIGRNTTLLPKK